MSMYDRTLESLREFNRKTAALAIDGSPTAAANRLNGRGHRRADGRKYDADVLRQHKFKNQNLTQAQVKALADAQAALEAINATGG